MTRFHVIPTDGITHYTMTEVVYGFIRDYAYQEGFPPTLADIAEGCGLKRATTVEHLRRLRHWGFIASSRRGGIWIVESRSHTRCQRRDVALDAG